MISSQSKDQDLTASKRGILAKTIAGINFELYLSLFFGLSFLIILMYSRDVLLIELSKAMLIICIISLFRFLPSGPGNSNNNYDE